MSGCHYCGEDDWFACEEMVLCANCLSPESLPAVSYDSYRALTSAEMELKRKRFTEGNPPGEYETPEYFDMMWRARKRAEMPDDLPPPFWRNSPA